MTADTHQRLPISAIVVCRDEAHHLTDCLSRLRFCDQIIVVDLQSHDGSTEIAGRLADLVLTHPASPIVEPVRCFAAQYARHDWLLFVDPDERYVQPLEKDIAGALADSAGVGIISLPMHYYFMGERLTCTVWGKPTHYRPALVHRRRCLIRPLILQGFALIGDATRREVFGRVDNHIVHHWMDSYSQLIEKHLRYLPRQGEALYKTGKRFNTELALRQPLREFKRNLLDRGGLRGGLRGIILSVVYSLFLAGSAAALLLYQVRHVHDPEDETGAQPVSAQPVNQRKAA